MDGSEHSMRALETAIQIAKKFHGKITLIHVYSVAVAPMIMPEPTTLMPSGVPAMTSVEVSKIVDGAREVGSRILADGRQKVEGEHAEVEAALKEGNVVQEIVKMANEEKYDLIVLGSRGRSKIRELLMGSVSDGVAKHALCPVLIVK